MLRDALKVSADDNPWMLVDASDRVDPCRNDAVEALVFSGIEPKAIAVTGWLLPLEASLTNDGDGAAVVPRGLSAPARPSYLGKGAFVRHPAVGDSGAMGNA
jgi:hypothetical protein